MKRRKLFMFLSGLFPFFGSKAISLDQPKEILEKQEEVEKIYIAAFDKDGKHLDSVLAFRKEYLKKERLDVLSMATSRLLEELKGRGVDLNTICYVYFTKEELEKLEINEKQKK